MLAAMSLGLLHFAHFLQWTDVTLVVIYLIVPASDLRCQPVSCQVLCPSAPPTRPHAPPRPALPIGLHAQDECPESQRAPLPKRLAWCDTRPRTSGHMFFLMALSLKQKLSLRDHLDNRGG